MPHRLLNLLPHAFPNPLTWVAGMFCATGSTALAVWTPEKSAAIALALLAFASQLAGPVARGYKWLRQARREEDIADLKATSQEVTRISEELGDTRSQLKAARDQVADLKTQLERLAGKAKAAVAQVNQKADAALTRLDAVEAQQGSSSNLELPATPEPKS